MNILRGQEQVSQKRALPVNEANTSPTVSTSSSTTVQLYYYSAGVRTSDAGQAAGTVVDATFANKNILNSLGTNVATKNDTSLAYTCTALTTELEISAVPGIATLMEALDNVTPSTRAAQVGALLNKGEYVIDYRRGLLIGKKATTASTMTGVTYQYTSGVIIASFPSGTGSIAIAEDTASTNGEIIAKNGSVRRDTAASSAGTDGDWATVNQDALGHAYGREGYAAVAEDNTNGLFATAPKPLATSTYSWTFFQNLGANATLNVKASAGNVFSMMMQNVSSGTRYLQIHNTATTPGGGAVPYWTSPAIPAGGSVLVDGQTLGVIGMYLSTGIAFACSTTAATYTAATATDHITQIQYK